METNEISIQEAKTFRALKACTSWITSKQLTEAIGEAAPRSVRLYLSKFVKLGLADLAEVWPGHRYRYSEKAGKRNAAYLQRLEKALEVFGIK